jgi:hypothetical protein
LLRLDPADYFLRLPDGTRARYKRSGQFSLERLELSLRHGAFSKRHLLWFSVPRTPALDEGRRSTR